MADRFKMMRRKRRRLSSNKEKRKRILTPALIREIFSWIFVTAVAVLFAFLAVTMFGYRVQVVGDSMEPTLKGSQQVLVNRVLYRLSSPKRGDVVAFLPNGNTKSYEYIKRVVAVPNDTVQIRDGLLVLNGEVVPVEETIYDEMEDAGIANEAIRLNAGEFFVLGDNRNSSEDSRNANIGVVKRDTIVGKVWYAFSTENADGGLVRR